MITFDRFSKRYGDHDAVRELTLQIGPGAVVALLGPNGSGKTTSLKAAAGLVSPTSGAVRLGPDQRPAHDPVARRDVSFLPQKVAFPDALTGLEVASFYASLRQAPASRVSDVLKFASLNGASGRSVTTYSGGMLQRLGLAVAMLPEAAATLLDEPTAALDPEGLDAFYRLVDLHRARGRTVLFTSHQLGDVERLADRVAVLVSGRLVASLTRDELTQRLSDRGVMRVRVDGATLSPDALARLRQLAPHASVRANEVIAPGPSTTRAAILSTLQACGVDVSAITTEEGRLDEFYRELVQGGGH